MPLWTVFAVVAVAQALTAPSQPDFSGRWGLISRASNADTPHVLVVKQAVTRTNIRGEPMPPAYLRVTMRRERDTGTSVETRLIGISGGSLGGIVSAAGATIPAPRTYTSTRWENDALIFRDGSYTGDAERTGTWTERRETWSLDSNGRLHIEITSEAAGAPRRTETLLYRRQ